MKGIIQSTEEVRSTLAGVKSMFRVPIKPQPTHLSETPETPPYHVGQRLFVKETWCLISGKVYYKEWYSENCNALFIWRPSTHMKEAESRTTLEIVSVGCEQYEGKWVFKYEFKVVEKG